MSIHNVFKNVPNFVAQSIQDKLSTEEIEALPLGVNFQVKDKTWNIQVCNNINLSCIRMSTEDTIHTWLFQSDPKMASLLRHCEILVSPSGLTATPFPERYYNIASYPRPSMTSPDFLHVIETGICKGKSSAPKLSSKVHQLAANWFEKNHIPNFLLPLSKPVEIQDSEFDPLLNKVDDEVFKKFFKYLAYISIAYCIYRVIGNFFPKAPRVVPPPKAILVE